MPRPYRCAEPGIYHFSTTRCIEERFYLRPDPQLNAAFGYWLARSLEQHPGITLHGAVAMSNHLHLETYDKTGSLSDFYCYFLGNLAKAVNRLRGRSGPLFGRRFDDGGRILDAEAAVERLAYLINNPVKAGLVARHRDWPGVLLYATDQPTRHHYMLFDEEGFLEATRHAAPGAWVDPEPFHRRASLTVHPLPFTLAPQGTTLIGNLELMAIDEDARKLINDSPRAATVTPTSPSASHDALNRVQNFENAAKAARETAGSRVMGADRVCEQDPADRPRHPNRSPRALCAASDKHLWKAFRRVVTAFARWYREAANSFWAGNPSVAYPPFSLHPGGARTA